MRRSASLRRGGRHRHAHDQARQGGRAVAADLAALSLAIQQLDPVRGDVQVVVFVGALAEVILGAGLLILSRYTGRRVVSAFFGTWLISALGLVHLAFETLLRIPGVSLEVTFPGRTC